MTELAKRTIDILEEKKLYVIFYKNDFKKLLKFLVYNEVPHMYDCLSRTPFYEKKLNFINTGEFTFSFPYGFMNSKLSMFLVNRRGEACITVDNLISLINYKVIVI